MANEVSVEITIEEKAALRALTKLSKGIDGTTKDATKSIKRMDAAFAVFAGNLAANAVGAMKDFAVQGVRAAATEMVDFDKRIREINTLLPKNTKLTEKTTDALKDMAGQFGTSQATQAKSFYQIISSGAATGARAVELLAQANKLAVGGIADVGSSINVLTDIINIYGAENITAEEAADSLFTTVRLGKTTISELASNMGAVLPSAQRLGVSLDDVGGALATMTTQGLTTGQRTTQLQALFTALFRKSGDASKLFGKKVGDAFSLAALRTKGLSKFLEDLQVATGGNEEVLTKLLGRMEGVQAVFALTGKNTNTLNSNLSSMTEKANAASEAFKEVEGSLDTQSLKAYQNTINKITEALAPLGEAVRKVLSAYNDVFEPETIASMTEKLKGLRAEASALSGIASNDVQDIVELENINMQVEALERKLSLEMMIADERRKLSGGIGVGEKADAITEPTGGEGSSPADDARVLKEKAVMAEIAMIRAEATLAEQERGLLQKEAAGLATEEDMQAIRDIEGEKLNIKAEAEQAKIDLMTDVRQRDLAQQKLIAKTSLDFQKLQTKQEVALEKYKTDEKKKLSTMQAANFKSSLGVISTLQTSGSKAGFAIGKAAAIADHGINAVSAVSKALASAPPPFNFAIAGLVGAAMAVQGVKIASSKPPGFESGGVVGGFIGASAGPDNVNINARKGEMYLNSTQQKTLFDDINTGGNNNGAIERLSASVEMLASQNIVVQIDNKEVARAVRDAQRDGFQVSA